MRKTSMILGLVAGTISSNCSISNFRWSSFNSEYATVSVDEDTSNELFLEKNINIQESLSFAGTMFMGIDIIILIAGTLAIIGGFIVNKNNIVAGIFMLIRSAICLFTLWAISSFIPLLLGGIFALISDNPHNQSEYQNQNIGSSYNNTFDI